MAETTSKRQREETHLEKCAEDSKRHKSYNHILSILEAEEDEPNQDLSSILTTLQQELSCESTCHTTETDQENPIASSTTSDYSPSDSLVGVLKEDEEEEERERVMRHLLEASDDELGIPHTHSVGHSGGDHDGEINGGDHAFALFNGLWEFEDEAANYYTLLQSELFM